MRFTFEASGTEGTIEMKALVYHGPGERGWDDVPDPSIIDATDIADTAQTLEIDDTQVTRLTAW